MAATVPNLRSTHVQVQMSTNLHTFKYTYTNEPELEMKCVFHITITFTRITLSKCEIT